jgi:hypothetical protein
LPRLAVCTPAIARREIAIFLLALAAVLSLFGLPRLLLGTNSYITIHDILDSVFVWETLYARLGGADILPYMMNVSPQNLPLPENWFLRSFFLWCDPFTAWILNELVVRTVGFSGMYALLRTHVLPLDPSLGDMQRGGVRNDSTIFASVAAATAFASLPYYLYFGLSIAGTPLLLHCFASLGKGSARLWHYAYVLFFPFCSSFVYIGPFALVSLGLWGFSALAIRNAPRLSFWVGLVLLTLCYLYVNLDLFNAFIFQNEPDFVSHRMEFDAEYLWGNSLASVLQQSASNFVYGQYHAASLHTPTLLLVPAAFGVYLYNRPRFGRSTALMLLLVAISAIISLIYGLFYWSGLSGLRELLPIMRQFQWNRLHLLAPLLWYLCFGLASAIILSGIGRRPTLRVIAGILVLAQVSWPMIASNRAAGKNEVVLNWHLMLGEIRPGRSDVISYSEFFSPDVFSEIADFIGRSKDEYRVVSIGLHPSIAQYNGFRTLDAYSVNYPLSYKHRFRQIIAGELEKSEKWQKYFDAWGSRCYVFVAEIENAGFLIRKESGLRIKDLAFDAHAFRSMGGAYVFSAVPIDNAQSTGLAFMRTFETPSSPWRIWLYGTPN